MTDDALLAAMGEREIRETEQLIMLTAGAVLQSLGKQSVVLTPASLQALSGRVIRESLPDGSYRITIND